MATNDDSWWPLVVMDDGEEGVRVWVDVWRREWKIVFFHIKERTYNCKSRLASSSHSLSENPLLVLSATFTSSTTPLELGFALSATLCAKHNSSCAEHYILR